MGIVDNGWKGKTCKHGIGRKLPVTLKGRNGTEIFKGQPIMERSRPRLLKNDSLGAGDDSAPYNCHCGYVTTVGAENKKFCPKNWRNVNYPKSRVIPGIGCGKT